MRILSQHTPVAQIRPQRQRSLGDGSIEITQEPIYAHFKSLQSGAFLYENEEILAERHFSFRGNTQDIGEAVPTNPLNRISVFDTEEAAQEENWDEQTKRLVEDWFELHAVQEPDIFLIITKPSIDKPFPNYDIYDGDPEALMIKLIEDGHDLEETLYYERVFGPKREPIIEALEQALEIKRELEVSA